MAVQPPPVTKLELDDDIKNAVNGALEAGHPIVMGYVGDSGYPRLSFPGSTQATGRSASPSGCATRRADS
jgi:hypothetical protein